MFVVAAALIVIGTIPIMRIREKTRYPDIRLPFTDLRFSWSPGGSGSIRHSPDSAVDGRRDSMSTVPSVASDAVDDARQRAVGMRLHKALTTPPSIVVRASRSVAQQQPPLQSLAGDSTETMRAASAIAFGAGAAGAADGASGVGVSVVYPRTRSSESLSRTASAAAATLPAPAAAPTTNTSATGRRVQINTQSRRALSVTDVETMLSSEESALRSTMDL